MSGRRPRPGQTGWPTLRTAVHPGTGRTERWFCERLLRRSWQHQVDTLELPLAVALDECVGVFTYPNLPARTIGQAVIHDQVGQSGGPVAGNVDDRVAQHVLAPQVGLGGQLRLT